jgi:hypothetical protein
VGKNGIRYSVMVLVTYSTGKFRFTLELKETVSRDCSQDEPMEQ